MVTPAEPVSGAAMVATEASAAVERAAALAADFATRAAEHDRDASFPFENFTALQAAGLLDLTVPVSLGGQGSSFYETCRVMETIAQGDGATALVLAMQYVYHSVFGQSPIAELPIWQRVCREATTEGALINVLRVEPELGTPARGGMPATTAVRTGSGWRLDGRKAYSTGAPILRYGVVWCRVLDAEGADPRTGYFLVPMTALGVRVEPTWDHMGMRATASDDVVFEGVELSAEHALDVRAPTAWARADPALFGWNGLVLSSLYHGIALAARDWLLGFLHARVPANLGASLATLPRFQYAAGEIQALLYASDRLIYTACETLDRGGYAPRDAPQIAFVKYHATNNAVKAVDIALDLTGNPGLTKAHPLERYHRDVLCSRIHTPQDDMITLNAGKAALGIQG
jgi:alkylation response protein AidB-like acyl-CoA dehydrogenase